MKQCKCGHCQQWFPLKDVEITPGYGALCRPCYRELLAEAMKSILGSTDGVIPPQHPPVPDPEPDVDDYYDEPVERPYCDECGSTLVTNKGCYADRCKRDYLHCPNTNCGNSPHCGEDWI